VNDQDVSAHGSEARIPDRNGDSLADVLERVLDKGVVLAGDIRVDLLDIELLTIRIRLLVCSADKAAELGVAWWAQDPWYTGLTSRTSGQDEAHTDEAADDSARQHSVRDHSSEARAGRDRSDERLEELLDQNRNLLERMQRLETGSGATRPASESSRRRGRRGSN
jgi:hypothetical protein